MISDQLIYLSMNEFLNPEARYYKMIKATPIAKSRKYQCLKGKGHINQQYHKSGSHKLDTGNAGCGWEVGKVEVSCSNGGVSGIRFHLRNIVDRNIHKKTPGIGSNNIKSVPFAQGHYFKGIDIHYSSRSGGHLTGFTFILNTGKSVSLSCGHSRRKESKRYKDLYRVTGFFGSKDGERIKSLGFYHHYLNLLQCTNLDYYELIRQDPYFSILDDKFIKLGMDEDRDGQAFEDPALQGHWDLSQIVFKLENDNIKSIQSKFQNKFFYYAQDSSPHGKTLLKNETTKTIKFSPAAPISVVRIFTGVDDLVCGIEFVFLRGRKSEQIGCKPGKGVKMNKQVDIPNQHEILGFYGWESDNGIESLGLLVLKTNNPKAYH